MIKERAKESIKEQKKVILGKVQKHAAEWLIHAAACHGGAKTDFLGHAAACPIHAAAWRQ